MYLVRRLKNLNQIQINDFLRKFHKVFKRVAVSESELH